MRLVILMLCLVCVAAGLPPSRQVSAHAQQNRASGGGGGGGTDINAGLSWHVPMNEGTGTSATNAVAGRSSITGLSLHTWTNGAFGSSLRWTNTDTRTPNGGNSGIGGMTKASLSVWFRRAASTERCYMSYLSADATLLLGAVVSWREDDQVRLSLTNNQNVSIPLLSSTLDTWEHIVWTFDSTSGGAHTNWVRGYINGIPKNMTFTGTVPPTIHADATNSYPGLNLVGGNFYIGDVDNPRVYTNLVIGTDVISSLYTNQ